MAFAGEEYRYEYKPANGGGTGMKEKEIRGSIEPGEAGGENHAKKTRWWAIRKIEFSRN